MPKPRISIFYVLSLLLFTVNLSHAQQARGGTWQATAIKAGEKFATGEVLVKFRKGKLSSAASAHSRSRSAKHSSIQGGGRIATGTSRTGDQREIGAARVSVQP